MELCFFHGLHTWNNIWVDYFFIGPNECLIFDGDGVALKGNLAGGTGFYVVIGKVFLFRKKGEK